jgi:hypothetical protein
LIDRCGFLVLKNADNKRWDTGIDFDPANSVPWLESRAIPWAVEAWKACARTRSRNEGRGERGEITTAFRALQSQLDDFSGFSARIFATPLKVIPRRHRAREAAARAYGFPMAF